MHLSHTYTLMFEIWLMLQNIHKYLKIIALNYEIKVGIFIQINYNNFCIFNQGILPMLPIRILWEFVNFILKLLYPKIRFVNCIEKHFEKIDFIFEVSISFWYYMLMDTFSGKTLLWSLIIYHEWFLVTSWMSLVYFEPTFLKFYSTYIS